MTLRHDTIKLYHIKLGGGVKQKKVFAEFRALNFEENYIKSYH